MANKCKAKPRLAASIEQRSSSITRSGLPFLADPSSNIAASKSLTFSFVVPSMIPVLSRGVLADSSLIKHDAGKSPLCDIAAILASVNPTSGLISGLTTLPFETVVSPIIAAASFGGEGVGESGIGLGENVSIGCGDVPVCVDVVESCVVKAGMLSKSVCSPSVCAIAPPTTASKHHVLSSAKAAIELIGRPALVTCPLILNMDTPPSIRKWSTLFSSLPTNAMLYSPRSFDTIETDGAMIPSAEVMQSGIDY